MRASAKSKKISYGLSALFVIITSLGVAAIVYGEGLLVFNPLNLVAFVIGPFGVYTIIYALISRRDRLYYLSWGLIMSITGLSFALYELVNVIVLVGLLLILLSSLGLLEYWRRKE
ncbi:MAG: hypothetical protein QXD66_02180 [Candidatus Nezhaarchaeales archaeon]|nr:MAG: hypothetical protein DSO05_04185 [Candidatus Nezhaarchaeota archaeon WYZ-LMO7]TDA36346.1 MAG: hypothetical protein DSO06_00520 [Candidatus Nezhaarchaeota archaeon WYZ-LMO8]